MSATAQRRRFAADKRGGIAIWFAAALLPIAMLIGAATDLRRVDVMRSAVQDASDAAVLSAAKAYLAAGGAENDPRRLAAANVAADAALKGNLSAHPDDLEGLSWTVKPVGGELVLETTGRVPLAFAGLFGMDAVPVKATAASVVSLRLEVAFVLDVTGSMNDGDKLGVLKASTVDLIGQLEAAAATSPQPNPLKLALVPYSNTVRVDPNFQNANWMDGYVRGGGYWNPPLAPAPSPEVDRFQSYPAGWAGCLESRPYPHDVRDTPPSAANRDTLFAPYFRPGGDPNAGCDIARVVPLTFNFASVKTAVQGMTANGYTNVPMGLVWGWHVLTPGGGPFGTGVAEPYGRPDLVKAVVLMTDGQNNLGDSADEYSGVGSMDQNRVGVIGSSSNMQRRAALDGRLSELCANMKERGIVIYTVRVEVDEGSDAVLRNCASRKADETPLFYDVPEASRLPAVFDKIGQDLIRLRLSR